MVLALKTFIQPRTNRKTPPNNLFATTYNELVDESLSAQEL